MGNGYYQVATSIREKIMADNTEKTFTAEQVSSAIRTIQQLRFATESSLRFMVEEYLNGKWKIPAERVEVRDMTKSSEYLGFNVLCDGELIAATSEEWLADIIATRYISKLEAEDEQRFSW